MPSGNNFGVVGIDWTATVPKLSLQLRDEDGDIAVQHKVPLDALAPREPKKGPKPDSKVEPVEPSVGAMTTAEAAKKVGAEVTVEFRVASTGKSGKRTFLNSAKNFRDKDNFTIVVEESALIGKWEKAGPETFANKVVRVKGQVAEYRDAPQIVVAKEEQIDFVEEKKDDKK